MQPWFSRHLACRRSAELDYFLEIGKIGSCRDPHAALELRVADFLALGSILPGFAEHGIDQNMWQESANHIRLPCVIANIMLMTTGC